MSNILLSVRGLKTYFGSTEKPVRSVDGVSFDIRKGETYALLGESGCGKSVTALSIIGLVPRPAGRIVSGSIKLDGEELLDMSEVAMRECRGNRISMIFQEPMTSLNPVLTIGEQIAEGLRRHRDMSHRAARKHTLELLDAVGLPVPQRRYDEFPHQLSGGMKQRVMIALALAGEPELLIADEPTTALDVTIQAQVLNLLAELQRQTGMSILLITHDLGIVSGQADRVAVMYAGQLVEEAGRDEFFLRPRHPYSLRLFEALPELEKRGHELTMIPGTVPSLSEEFVGCSFAERCDLKWELCRFQVPRWMKAGKDHGVRCHLADSDVEHQPSEKKNRQLSEQAKVSQHPAEELLHVQDLKVHFPIHKGLFKRIAGYVYAVDGVSLVIPTGRTLALVGESGCGKTTVGKGVLQLIRPTAGSVRFKDLELTTMSNAKLRSQRAAFQIVFQDPFSSMNPRMLVGDIIEEGMVAQGIGLSREERVERTSQLLEQVGMSPDARRRYPHEFSGGQRQRICIARALAVNPQLIVCDEPTSALDVSVQAQILNLLKKLQIELGLSYLFITHNISVVAYLAHEINVMYLGRIVEQGPVETVLQDPQHPYTRALLSSVPVLDKEKQKEFVALPGEPPSPIHPPLGCHFHPRCSEAMPICRQQYPKVTTLSDLHYVRCFLYQQHGRVVS